MTAVNVPTAVPGRVAPRDATPGGAELAGPRHRPEPEAPAPELLTFLDAAHRRIEELELELEALRRQRTGLSGRGGRRLGRSA